MAGGHNVKRDLQSHVVKYQSSITCIAWLEASCRPASGTTGEEVRPVFATSVNPNLLERQAQHLNYLSVMEGEDCHLCDFIVSLLILRVF